MSRTAGFVIAGIGALILIGAPTVWWLSQPFDTVGDPEAVLGAPTDAESTNEQDDERLPSGLASPEDGADGAVDDPAGTDGDEADLSSSSSVRAGQLAGPLAHHPVPTRIEIASLAVDAPVVPVGLEPDGSMEIPHDVQVVGWYEPGVRPGQEGSAVLSGHVDSRDQGPGALYDLRSMELGERIVTHGDRGEPRVWEVVARTRYGKAELPIDDLFVWEGSPRLVVITCGGDFDAATRSYSDNVVVIAEPVV